MPYIYKITNDINEKVYIGKTHFSVEERWKQHCREFQRSRNEKRPLYAAMKKYGIEHFYVELIEETNNPEEREKYWIEYYSSFKYGYNATTGGDGKPYIDRQLVKSLYNKLGSCKEVAETMGIGSDTVSKILKETGVEVISSQAIIKARYSKAVLMLDKTRTPLRTFSSLHEAARYLQSENLAKSQNIDGIRGHIGDVCKGKRKTAYGFIWEYVC